MNDKKTREYFFLSGLPRSGSTLLCNVLSQNPDFYVTPTSSIIGLMRNTKNMWSQMPSIKASDHIDDKVSSIRIMRGMFEGYFSNTDKKYCVDKSRGWCGNIEMAEEILGHPVKLLVTVRDIREVLASFESLWRKNTGHRAIPQEMGNPDKFNTIEGRLEVFMDSKEVVGSAYNQMRDAVHKGYAKQMLFVDFESFTHSPEKVMNKIYDFLEIPRYKHDFNNVKQVVFEKDEYHGFDDLHTIRAVITPVLPKWPILIGEAAAKKYEHLNFWTKRELKLNTTLE
ncbi:MAG: sulfotransferase [Candidatus Paceibacterota bacterium]|jgi:sulfotransferase